jgi:hypothetical protein
MRMRMAIIHTPMDTAIIPTIAAISDARLKPRAFVADRNDLRDGIFSCFSQLVAIHVAPEWLWSALVAATSSWAEGGAAIEPKFSAETLPTRSCAAELPLCRPGRPRSPANGRRARL